MAQQHSKQAKPHQASHKHSSTDKKRAQRAENGNNGRGHEHAQAWHAAQQGTSSVKQGCAQHGAEKVRTAQHEPQQKDPHPAQGGHTPHNRSTREQRGGDQRHRNSGGTNSQQAGEQRCEAQARRQPANGRRLPNQHNRR